MEDILSTVNAEPVANVEPQETTGIEPIESVIEEVATPQTVEKPVQSQEDNAKFAQIRREAESKARDKVIEEMYGESHGIKTYADYQKAVKEQEEAQRRQELVDKGYDPDTITDLVSNLPEVQWAKDFMTKQQQEQAQQQDQFAFLDWFREENGRAFDADKDQISPEVWQEHQQGKSLKEAYISNQYIKSLKNELASLKTNQANASASTGSVTGNGTTVQTQLTEEMVNQMSPQELSKRWEEVKNLFKMK